MRIVIALGGNALLQRGQPMTAENQRANIRIASEAMAKVADGNQLVIAHGNGPQVGLLALQSAAYTEVDPYPLDVLGAQTDAMIGYVIEQELGNLLPFEQPLATMLTMIEVDPDDPAFQNPTKPIGPVYDKETAERLAAEGGWSIAPDGDKFRRVVASPKPKRIFEIRPIRMLVDAGVIVVCAGGGGIPTMYDQNRKLQGVEAVIDKDLTSAHIANVLDIDELLILTAVPRVAVNFGKPNQKELSEVSLDEIKAYHKEGHFPPGSMGPKVDAAIRFLEGGGKRAIISHLDHAMAALRGQTGTHIVRNP